MYLIENIYLYYIDVTRSDQSDDIMEFEEASTATLDLAALEAKIVMLDKRIRELER